MELAPLPSQAAWHHRGVRRGFEVVWPVAVGPVTRLRGASTGVEDDRAWSASYDVEAGPDWSTRTARVAVQGRDGEGEVLLERDEHDRWSVDGVHRPDLDGCRDVDLEASVVTNTLPLHRLPLVAGRPEAVDAVFVALDLRVSRLAQVYELRERAPDGLAVAYAAPAYDVACTLVLDDAGLVLDYPGLASRA